MASSLNVIALISGGKDSLFSILHCQANGHHTVALANLHPGPSVNDDQDINSYMYQTVGHSVIPLYEQALGLPLYRQKITGTAVDSSRDYATPSQKQEQDETEDLVPLLKRVMDAHPEANAVSTGAILSTYQRTRVESVALRLGLTPLSYLWQYPLLPPYTQSSLLHDMSAVGQEAIIIKTASGGLDEDFLGLDVANPRTIARLAKAMGRYGDAGDGAILGEGGEFETLALNGPKPLWKKRIRIENGPPAPLDGGQAVLKVKASILEEKTGESGEAAGLLRIPDLFDDEFARISQVALPSKEEKSSVSGDATPDGELSTHATSSVDVSVVERLPRNVFSETRTVFTYSNLTSDTHSISSTSSPSRQLIKVLLRLDHILQQQCLSKASVNHCTLLLRDMTDFTVLNPIYAQYFSDVNPPARATIAVGNTMPEGVDVILSVIIDKDNVDGNCETTTCASRQGLHVQGRSYWAPANIGPYSQAISARLPAIDGPSNDNGSSGAGGEIVYVAGQIPLVPASMAVYQDGGFKGQTALSLQHLWRIGRAKKVRWWTAAVALIPDSAHAEEDVGVALQAWKAIHTSASSSSSSVQSSDKDQDEDEDAHVDPWDRLNTHHTPAWNDSTTRSPLPDGSAVSPDQTRTQNVVPMAAAAAPPPCFVAQVASLPRGVHVEWCASGLTAHSIRTNRWSDSSCLPPPPPPPLPTTTTTTTTITTITTTTSPQNTRTRFITLQIRGKANIHTLQPPPSCLEGRGGHVSWTNATLYVGRGFTCDDDDDKTDGVGWKGVQWIPCQRVWGEDGEEVQAVLVGRVDVYDGE